MYHPRSSCHLNFKIWMESIPSISHFRFQSRRERNVTGYDNEDFNSNFFFQKPKWVLWIECIKNLRCLQQKGVGVCIIVRQCKRTINLGFYKVDPFCGHGHRDQMINYQASNCCTVNGDGCRRGSS